MSNLLFAIIKKALPASKLEVRLVEVEKNLDTGVTAGIQHLAIEEYSTVAGGPEVQNDPV